MAIIILSDLFFILWLPSLLACFLLLLLLSLLLESILLLGKKKNNKINIIENKEVIAQMAKKMRKNLFTIKMTYDFINLLRGKIRVVWPFFFLLQLNPFSFCAYDTFLQHFLFFSYSFFSFRLCLRMLIAGVPFQQKMQYTIFIHIQASCDISQVDSYKLFYRISKRIVVYFISGTSCIFCMIKNVGRKNAQKYQISNLSCINILYADKFFFSIIICFGFISVVDTRQGSFEKRKKKKKQPNRLRLVFQ